MSAQESELQSIPFSGRFAFLREEELKITPEIIPLTTNKIIEMHPVEWPTKPINSEYKALCATNDQYGGYAAVIGLLLIEGLATPRDVNDKMIMSTEGARKAFRSLHNKAYLVGVERPKKHSREPSNYYPVPEIWDDEDFAKECMFRYAKSVMEVQPAGVVFGALTMAIRSSVPRP